MNVRHSTMADLPEIMAVYAHGRELMRQRGNPTQWGDHHPAESLIVSDIEKGIGYIIEDNGEICAAFAFIIGRDPTYTEIWDGGWMDDEMPYGTIHRLATNGKRPGMFSACLAWAETQINNIRVDTHRDNAAMLHLFASHGFTRCGIIRIEDGTLRIAWQKIAGGQQPSAE